MTGMLSDRLAAIEARVAGAPGLDVDAYKRRIVAIADKYPDAAKDTTAAQRRDYFTVDQRLAWALRFGHDGRFEMALCEVAEALFRQKERAN